MLPAALSAAFILVAGPAACLAEGDGTADDLKQVRVQLQREERRMGDFKKRAGEYLRAEEQLSNQLEDTAKKKATVAAQLDSLRTESDALAATLLNTKTALGSRAATLQKRVVAVYKATRGGPSLGYIFGAGSPNEFVKRTKYLERISAFDRDYAVVLQKMLVSMERDKSRLDRLTADKTAAVSQLAKLEQELGERREKKAALLKEEQDHVAKQETLLGKLRGSANRLEQVVANIMGGERVPAPPPAPDEADQPPPTDHPEVITAPSNNPPQQEGGGIIMTPYTGRGLEVMRGKLLFPVGGELVQRFGKQRHEEFSDVLFVKGVEVKAPVGAQVRAVAEGKVVLSQVLPGYGNVIIVDHGQRYYTLYGRLASSLKSLGDSVKQGEALAVLGELDYKGRNFYFELRVKGKAVNPADYCKSLPESTNG